MSSMKYAFTSESVCEGHPDKVCDYIADSVLDAYLSQDRTSRVACEVLCKENQVILGGEITSTATVDQEAVARQAIREVGYTNPQDSFSADGVSVSRFISQQAREIACGVDPTKNRAQEQGAGDQGIMFGYATDETPELMPLPILLAHRLSRGLADDRKNGTAPWLRPDGKTQVSVLYEGNTPKSVTDLVVSTQHREEIQQSDITGYIREHLVPRALGQWFHSAITFHINPTGSFCKGGPSADCGVTGRKIIVDTYGGAARHGGGAFSGKDPSKVDRSGAYFCRFVARNVVRQRLAKRVEIQVAYAIGVARQISTMVRTFGTGDDGAVADYVKTFDFRPASVVERLNLLRPIYRSTTNYGHFGRPGLPWEE
jgi:S-adenosylmethionine synthetase